MAVLKNKLTRQTLAREQTAKYIAEIRASMEPSPQVDIEDAPEPAKPAQARKR